MPFNSVCSFQTSNFPYFKYNLKVSTDKPDDSIYSFNNAYKIYKFINSGTITFTISKLVVSNSDTNTLNYCIVGGGGGGSGAVKVGTVNGVDMYAHGAGGGGGQIKTGSVYICSSENIDQEETITVTIGEGGEGTPKNTSTTYPPNIASSGMESSIAFSQYNTVSGVPATKYRESIIAIGGNGGKTLKGGNSGNDNYGGFTNVATKGSGGGGGSDVNKGGYGDINGGTGAAGMYSTFFKTYLGGGGGGGLSDYHILTGSSGKGNGGNFGDGAGGNTTSAATDGVDNYGCGGGGGGGGYLNNYDGAKGGSGIVFLWVSY
jgi:hypothetical protein